MKVSIPPSYISFFIWCTTLGVLFFSFLIKALIHKQNKNLIVSIDLCCTGLIFLSIFSILNFLRALSLIFTLLPDRVTFCLCHLLHLLVQHLLTFSSLKNIAIFRIQTKGSIILRTTDFEGYDLHISFGIHSGVGDLGSIPGLGKSLEKEMVIK